MRPLSPCPCKAAAPKGPVFYFLNYIPRRLRGPTRADSIKILIMSWRIARSTPLVVGCQPEVFCPWVVSTDTHGRSGDMGDRCVALAWPGAVEDRPDFPSDRCRRRHWPNDWSECSSLSTHCTKLRGSSSVGTIFAHTSTRLSVRTHRGSHPTRPGRRRGARRKVAHRMVFRSLETPLGCSETPLGTSSSYSGGRRWGRRHGNAD